LMVIWKIREPRDAIADRPRLQMRLKRDRNGRRDAVEARDM
jgi:hypothetical protein